MAKNYDLIVFIGRFQPFHKGHYQVAKEAIAQTDSFLIVLGGKDSPRDSKNPYTVEERKKIIQASFTEEELLPFGHIEAICDYADDAVWMTALENIINTACSKSNAKIAIIGHEKDASSYYLRQCAEKWHVILPDNMLIMSASDIRDNIYSSISVVDQMVNSMAAYYAEEYIRFHKLVLKQEHNDIIELDQFRSKCKFPIEYTTVAAIVKYNDFYLVNSFPLKFPGGLIENNNIVENTIADYIKSTGIVVPDECFIIKEKTSTPHISLYGSSNVYTLVYDLSSYVKNLPKINRKSSWLHYTDLISNKKNFDSIHYELFLDYLIKQ